MVGSTAKMSGTFDTLTAARKLEAAGMDRKQAEAVVCVIRDGPSKHATRNDLRALHNKMVRLQWMLCINVAISSATLAVALAMTFQL